MRVQAARARTRTLREPGQIPLGRLDASRCTVATHSMATDHAMPDELAAPAAAAPSASVSRLSTTPGPVVLALLMVCAAVYAGELSGPLLFDDQQAIVDNSSIRTLALGQALAPPQETPVAGRPVANLSLALDYVVLGGSALSFHATNLLLHALVALLAYLLLRESFAAALLPAPVRASAGALAAASALIFCAHPLAVELVLYATQRTESLAALFYLAALLGVALAARAGSCRRLWPAVLGVGLLGAGSKEVFVTAPVVALFFDRAFFAGSFARALRERWPVHASLAASWLATLWLAHGDPRPGSVRFAEWGYLIAQAKIVPGYFVAALWPAHPALDYGPLLPQSLATSWPYLLGSGLAATLAVVVAFVRPLPGFFGVWVLGILAPSSSLLSIHTEVGAERRFYLPLIALIAVGVLVTSQLTWWAVERHPQLQHTGRRVLASALGLLLLALVASARAHAGDFATLRAAWQSAVQARPDNPRAHYNLAETLRREGELGGAEAALRATLQLQDDYADAHANLAGLLLARGAVDEALPHLLRAAQLLPSDPQAHFNYGLALGMAGRFADAAGELQRSLQLAPNQPRVRLSLASALFQLQRFDAARTQAMWLVEHVPEDLRGRALLQRIDAQQAASAAQPSQPTAP